MELLEAIPRYPLVAGETPLQELSQLSRRLGRRILVKRDDLTGLALGGNKVRQAEFFVGEALAQGADTVIAGGGFAQSNHARVLAGAARAAGLDPVILLRPGSGPSAVDGRGNALLTRLLAAEVRVLDELAEAPAGDRRAEVAFRRAVFESVADELRAAGRRPYVVLGSSTGLGCLGYVAAAAELHDQLDRLGLDVAKVFLTSLGATHAGLELGLRLLGSSPDVVGMAYQPADRPAAEETVRHLIGEAAALLGVGVPDAVVVRSDVADGGPGYGVPSAAARAALALAAATDGLVLDPTYTAKGFAGLLRWVEDGAVAPGETVVFVHTGGLPGLFARSLEELIA